jgi:hypothetical protein
VAVQHLVPEHHRQVERQVLAGVRRTREQVRQRLTAEINWDIWHAGLLDQEAREKSIRHGHDRLGQLAEAGDHGNARASTGASPTSLPVARHPEDPKPAEVHAALATVDSDKSRTVGAGATLIRRGTAGGHRRSRAVRTATSSV